MRGLQLIPYNTKIDFVGIRYYVYLFSVVILLVAAWSLGTKGLNLGIDFKGGFLMEVRTSDKPDIGAMRSSLEMLGIGDVKLQEFGGDQTIMIRLEKPKGGDTAQQEIIQKVKGALGDTVQYRRIETVGAKVSNDLVDNAVWAVLFSLVGMLLYVWFRFEWQFGVCGIVALMHDAVVVLGYYSLFSHEFNDTAFIAILTTIGYSINDSVVIYDRIRENLRKYKKMPLTELINLSTNETLSRTILTVGTTVTSLLALCYFGGTVIYNFCFPILVGIVFGAFSSIFLSANLLLFFDVRRGIKDPENKTKDSRAHAENNT